MTERAGNSIIYKYIKCDENAGGALKKRILNERMNLVMANTKTRKPMSVRSKGLIWLVLLLAVTVAVSCLSICGMRYGDDGVNLLLPWVPVSSQDWPASLPLSRSLGGGDYTEYTVSAPEGSEESVADLANAALKVMKARLSACNLNDVKVSLVGESTIRVELPKTDDAANVLSMLSSKGNFEFRIGDEAFMTGADIKTASVGQYDTTTYMLGLQTTEEGKQKLADATSANINGTMSIYQDGALLISATVPEAFTSGTISVPLGESRENTEKVAAMLNNGTFSAELTQGETGELENDGSGSLRALLIIAAVMLAVALVYLVITGKLTGLAGIWSVWCAILMMFFFFATLVLATVNVAVAIVLLLGILLAIFTAVTRTDAISKETAKGLAPKAATKAGIRAAGKLVWLVHGGAMVIACVLMLIPGTKVLGYTLSAAVVASAFAAPLMRLFQSCFTMMSTKPGLFGKTK